MRRSTTCHLLSVDFESWVFGKKINDQRLSLQQLRNLDNGYTLYSLDYLLKILKKYDQRITFFVVAKLEELYPGIMEKILKHGHEVGWHSYSHAQIDNADILREELEASKKYIKIYNIRGFQAPAIHFFKEGYKILKEYNFVYSSSIYGPSEKIYTFYDMYEIPISVSRRTYQPQVDTIEFPSHMDFKNILRFGIPYGSGLFWGILPEQYYFSQLQSNQTKNFFIHEWQLITPTAREYKKDVSFFSNPLFFPYRINVKKKFEDMLANFRFQKHGDYIQNAMKK